MQKKKKIKNLKIEIKTVLLFLITSFVVVAVYSALNELQYTMSKSNIILVTIQKNHRNLIIHAN